MAYLDSSGVTQLTSAIKNLADASYPQQSAIADPYSSTSTYAIGDRCIKDGKLYKCKTAINTAEAWNASHWSNTSVADELDDVSGLPAGGTQGQILTKNSSTDGDASWANAPTELPSVSASDNGKVLTVSNGAWGKAAVPTELPSVSTSDNGKILQVSSGAWAKGDAPISLPTGGTQGQVLTKNSATAGDASWANAPTELPSVSASDNGKVLTVSNGAWSKAAVPTELPSVTTSDNGKVLQVSGGAWTKGAAPISLPTGGTQGQVLIKNSSTAGDASWADGPSTMIVTFTLPSGGGSVYTSDKTFAEVLAAIEHGWTVLGKANGKLYSMIYYESASIKFHSTWMEMRDADTFNENVAICERSIYMLPSTNIAYDPHSVNVTPNAPGVYYIELDDNQEPDDEYDLYYVSASNIDDIGHIFNYYNWGSDVNNSHIFLRYRGGTYEDEPSDLYQLTQKYTTEENGNYIGHCVFQCIAENNGSVVLKQFTVSDAFEQYFFIGGASITYSERALGGGQAASGVSF